MTAYSVDPLQKYRVHTVYIWFWPTLDTMHVHTQILGPCLPCLKLEHTCRQARTCTQCLSTLARAHKHAHAQLPALFYLGTQP